MKIQANSTGMNMTRVMSPGWLAVHVVSSENIMWVMARNQQPCRTANQHAACKTSCEAKHSTQLDNGAKMAVLQSCPAVPGFMVEHSRLCKQLRHSGTCSYRCHWQHRACAFAMRLDSTGTVCVCNPSNPTHLHDKCKALGSVQGVALAPDCHLGQHSYGHGCHTVAQQLVHQCVQWVALGVGQHQEG